MAYQQTIVTKAKTLRRAGLTHREIAKRLNIGLGSAHLWTKDIRLTVRQKEEIEKRKGRPYSTQSQKAMLRLLMKKRFKHIYEQRRYTRKELLEKIKSFYGQHGRIPLKREFNMYNEYKTRFGNWNNAIKKAGFRPNEVIFSKRTLANDGHICDSFAEKIIDDWLFRNGIPHQRHVVYGDTKLTADFVIGNLYVEYFGLQSSAYKKIISRKRKLCRKLKIKLLEIYPNNLFSVNFKKCLGNILEYARRAN